MNRTSTTITLTLGLLVLAAGCKAGVERGAAASGSAASEAPPNPAADNKTDPAQQPAAKGRVKRIVVLDKAKACACTQKRTEATWNELTGVVGFPPVPDVERIHMDTQADKAAPYKAKRPVMVPPAIYFFGEGDELLEVLQGEVTADQIRRVLE